MVIICYDSDTIEYDRGKTELSDEPLRITQDANSIEKFGGRLTYLYLSAANSLRRLFQFSKKVKSLSTGAHAVCVNNSNPTNTGIALSPLAKPKAPKSSGEDCTPKQTKWNEVR